MNNLFPVCLTIAGSDSGGGAGIQADLRTFTATGVYGCSVITAITAQNPNEVRRVDVLPAEAVKTQLETVLDELPIRVAKTGMLANEELVECVAMLAKKYRLELVVDPVMVSTSEVKLLEDTAISAIKNLLFPLAKWITPNIPEAELICNRKLTTADDLAEAALELHNKYSCNCVLKSGHSISTNEVTDIVCHEGKLYTLSSPLAMVDKITTHGTGCTLSSALAANLALKKDWQEALICAKAFVYGSLCENVKLNTTLSQMYPPKANYLTRICFREKS